MKIETIRVTNKKQMRELVGDVFAEEIISSLQPPFSDDQVKGIVRMSGTEATQAGAAYRQEKHSELEEAKAVKKNIDAQVQENHHLLDGAMKAIGTMWDGPGRVILAVFLLVCFASCLVAEWTLTWNTLPYILNIRQYSFEGVMLALAPTAALAILKVVIALMIWERWQAARSNPSIKVQVAGWVLMIVFLFSVGWMNLYTVGVISPAREEVAKLKRNLRLKEGEVAEPVDLKKINRAIYWVSICVAVDGALFFLIGLKELNASWSLFAVLLLRFRQRRLENKQSQAEAQLNVLQTAWEHIDERAAKVVEHYRDRLSITLDQVLKRPHRQRSHRETVDEILSSSIRN